jgi:ATP-dependent protease ClpP protease subunit
MSFQSKMLSSMCSNKGSRYLLNDESIDEPEIENNIKVVNNDVFFYSPVDSTSIFQVTTALSKLIKDMQLVGIILGIEPPPIKLYINSDGGEVHSALSLYDFISNSPVKIITIITGNASSAATIISLSGHERQITKNSYMLIHNISSTFWGKMHEFEDEMKNMAKLTSNLKGIYREKSKINKRTIESLLKKDLLLDAETCLKYGFVDTIV